MDHRQPSIFQASLELFRDNVLRSPTSSQEALLQDLLQVLTSIMLAQIQMERDGDVIDKANIKKCVEMLEMLYIDKSDRDDQRLYIATFEPAYLHQTKEFFIQEAERLMGACDAGTYCREVERRIQEELDRCKSTLSPITMPKVEVILVEELVRSKIKPLIESDSGVVFMIENSRIEQLKDLYTMSARVDINKTDLKKAVTAHVIQEGNEINKGVLLQPATPQQAASTATAQPLAQNQQTLAALRWVEDVLALKDKYDNIWKRSFDQDQVLHAALTRSFSDFINSTTFNRGSEFISLFIDDNMKKGIKDKTEAQVDEVLDKAIEVLKYVVDKDLFERYYKKHLSRRLLMNKSISIDVEKQMISRMKIELGNSFTGKLEAMFKDMATSQDLTQGYRDHIEQLDDKDPTRIDLKIDVLTSGTWPIDGINTGEEDSASKMKVIYPPAIQRVIQAFERFYADKHSGRKLTWQPHLGTADMSIRFQNKQNNRPTRQHDVNVPTSGMIVLLLFQDLDAGESLTYEDIKASTNIWDHELKRILQSLAVAKKTQILKKEPMSREISPTDRFFFNENFKSDYKRVKVGMIAASNRAETERERAQTEQKIDEERNHVLEAAIVRIMKYVVVKTCGYADANSYIRAKKNLSHEKLIIETINQLTARFKPDIPMIKSRIENLIEREYLERVEDANPPSYTYRA